METLEAAYVVPYAQGVRTIFSKVENRSCAFQPSLIARAGMAG
jgi:hypothetical protein